MDTYTQEILIGNKKITLSTGTLAPQANAAVVAQYGDTVVLATVVMGKLSEDKDYFPLTVEFVDKLFAGGIVKGGKWMKREMSNSDVSILFGRIIDRSIRPLFPQGFKNEVQIIATVLSNDKNHDVIIPAFTAVSTALAMSSVPFNSYVSAVKVGLIDNELTVLPTLAELKNSQMDLLVCTGPFGVNMIEADANIVDNETVLKGIELAKTTSEALNKEIEKFVQKTGKPKINFQPTTTLNDLIKEVEKEIKGDVEEFLKKGAEANHMEGQNFIMDKAKSIFQTQIESGKVLENTLKEAVDEIIKKYLRKQTLTGKRYDGRKYDEIRNIDIKTGILPCTHGSAMFQRGFTQVLTVTTLDTLTEKQHLEDSLGETTKRYIHYYSAMPFSTGEAGRVGRPGRREIGHGALAEKALNPVIPSESEFPYMIVLNSEILSQNGSSSMASTCGSTLSLMEAGVPIKDKVAGISIGMMSDENDKYVLLTDIAGIEDHFGDMDFKITGTKNGITAIQLDVKRPGLTIDMIKDVFKASTIARLKIIDIIEKIMPQPKAELSVYAPKIKMVKLPEDKIGEVIGSGGKTIKGLMEKYGVQIDIDDDGSAFISSKDTKQNEDAAFEIESMIREVQIGEEFDGMVTRVEMYGAFVEFLPGREALLHVSEMSGGFIANPSAIIKVGDRIRVKISGFNDNHQIKLAAPEFKAANPGSAPDNNNRTNYNKPESFGKFTAPRQGFKDRRRR